MKLLFLVLILIIISKNSDGLSCIQTSKTIDGLNNSTLSIAQEFVNNIELDDENGKCIVETRHHHRPEFLVIKLGKDFTFTDLEANNQVHIDTSIFLTDKKSILIPARIQATVKFACDYAGACDRRFVLDHLPWLIQTNHQQLEFAIRPLLIADDDNTGLNIIEKM
jgi:hypothetical protein